MATNDKRAYWINLQKTNPEEYKRRRRMAYWGHLKQEDPKKFQRLQREQQLRDQHPYLSKEQAANVIDVQDKLFEENQLSLF